MEAGQPCGRYLEEFEVGEVMRHAIARTVAESDNIQFCAMTIKVQPLHETFGGQEGS